MDTNTNNKAMKLSDHQFKRLMGVKKQTAGEMLEILQTAYGLKIRDADSMQNCRLS